MWKYILGAFGVLVVFGVFFMFNGMSVVKNMPINNVDLGSVSDGTYTGAFKVGRWSSKVEVTVKDHKITDIKMVSADPTVTSVSQDSVSKVIADQKLDIDIVSGATVTTKALLKSIENALAKAN